MENQHQHIKGYRDLSPEEIELMNLIKGLGEQVGSMINSLRNCPNLDQRWVSIAQTDLQKGFMAAVRAVAKPTTF